MNFRTTVALVVLLAAIGAYFLLVESKVESGREVERRERVERSLPGDALFTVEELSTESVDSVTVRRAGEPEVVFEREGAEWWQVSPVRFRAKDWSVRNIVDNVATLRSSAGLDDGGGGAVSLEDASLEPPLATVTVRAGGEGGGSATVHLGRKSVGGKGFLLKGEDATVLVVNDGLHRVVLEETAADWRSRSLKVPSAKQADRVVLRGGGGEVSLLQEGDAWRLEGASPGRADRDAVQKLLADAGTVYVGKFVAERPEDLGVYGLDEPAVELTVRVAGGVDAEGEGGAGEGSEMRLAVGSAADLTGDAYFASWFDVADAGGRVVFTITRADKEKLGVSADNLRDPRVTVLKAGEVREFRVERPGLGGFAVVRGADGWGFEGDGLGFEADSGLVSGLVGEVVGVQALRYEHAAGFDEGALRATVTLTGLAGVGSDTVRLYGGGEGGELVARRNDEAVGYVVAGASLGGVFEPVGSLRDRTVLDVGVDEVVGLTVRNSHGVTYSFVREGGSEEGGAEGGGAASTQPGERVWSLVGQERFERRALVRVVEAMFPLRCERWAGARGGAGDEAGGRVIEVVVETSGGGSHTVLFDAGDLRGWLGGSGEWFVVDRSLVGMLDQEFRDRVALPLSLDGIRSLEFDRGGEVVTVRRDEGGGYRADGGVALDQEAVGAVFDGLAPLRVERYVGGEGGGEALVVVGVELAGGGRHEVRVVGDAEDRLAEVDGRLCVLGVDLYDRLVGGLVLGSGG